MWHLLEPLHGVCQHSTLSWAVNTCLGIASNIESTSLLCWPSGAGARHRRRMSSQVCSLYRCESGWSKRVQARVGHSYHLNYLFILPLWSMECRHLMPTSVQIWCSFIGAERPKTWSGSSQKLGRIDRVWGGSGADRPGADRLWGGSSVSRTLSRSRLPIMNWISQNDITFKVIPSCVWHRTVYTGWAKLSDTTLHFCL